MLETTAPEASSVLPRVPPRPVTRRHALTNAAVSDVSPFTGSVTEGPPLVVAGIGHSAATRPLDRLKLVLAASASSTGTSLEEHVSEMVHTGSTSCPTWDPAAVEQKGSPGSAVRHAHGYLIPSPWEPIRATSGLEALVGGTTRALTYSAVLTGVKPPIGTFTDTTTYSPPHELPTSQGISTQSSTAACCPVTSSSVSRARTAARLTSAALHEASAKRGMLPAQEETDVVAKVPPGSSELPLAASSTAPTTELLSHSTWAKPPAQLARKHYSLRRLGMRRKLSTPARLVLSPSTTPLPSRTAGQPGPKAPTSPQNKTLPVLSSERSKARSDLMETNASCATPLYPNRTGLALLAEPTPVGKEHTPAAGLGSGVPVSSTAASSKWKPTSAVLGEYKVLDKSTKASDFSGLASAEPPSSATPSEWISTSTAVSKATPVKTRAAVSMPLPPAQRTTTQPSGPQPPVFQPPTEAKPTVVSSHHVATRSPAPKTTAWLTSARTPVAPDPWLPTAPKQTRLVPWNKTTVPTLFRHPTTISSKHLPLSPQRTSTAPTGIHVLTRTRAAKPNLTTAVTSKGVAPTKTAHASKQMLPESRVPKQNFSSTQGTGSASSPTSPAQQLSVRILPLRFRLLRIAYSVLLKDKSSQAYQKLEKEVTLMLNKMFSSYQNFLKANIVQFLNGSAIVVSEVLFQGDRPTPTSSDLIRTVITEVERQMDAFFDWRVDVTSVQSNGFSLENLEPEKLLVSFTALRLGWIVTAGGVGSQGPLQRLNDAVVQSLGTLYKVKNFSIIKLRDLRGDLEISGEAYVDTQAHADISQVLQALRGLVNYSVDLTMLSVDDARLNLQVFPISFLINNRVLSEKLLDRSSVEHQNLTRDLDDVLTHALRKYQSFLQVIIRELLGGSLICRGDVVFQHPAPSPADVLQALVLSVGPGDALAKSGFRVDPYSFTVAGDQVEPPSVYRFPGYGVAIIVLCGLVMITLLVLALLYLNSGLFGWRGKAIIQGGRDPEVGMQTFELENQGFHSTIEEEGGRQAYTPTKHSAGE
ncbi:uncharacterized protein LOC142019668 [Carettochelys insculpta]|uniref:uncharacterized protein LOC142019668 n=1 Tax=Carettochelys insculpta TaxID=44489 RepID=UPI003EBAFC6F